MTSIKELTKQEMYFCVKVDHTLEVGHTHVTGKMMLAVCTHGACHAKVGKEELTVDRRHFLFLHPHAEVTVLSTSPDFRGYCIGFSMGIQESEVVQLDPNFFAQILKTPRWPLIGSQREAMEGFCSTFHYVYQHVHDDLKTDIISSLFATFLKTFYASTRSLYEARSEQTNASTRTLTMRFFTLLHKHYREDHRVTFYAEKLCVSPKYLTQVIKSACHTTPKAIIDHRLAVEALYKLGRTSSTIQEISFYLGFPDQSYFGRFFKRMFGLSPLAYRLNPNLDLMQRLTSSQQAAALEEESEKEE